MLAQGGNDSGLAVLEAVQNGGNFASWKRALSNLESEQQAPWRKLFKLAKQSN